MNCVAQVTVFRDSGQLDNGLWALRGFSRFYFGRSGDRAVPADYDGSGVARAALFRPASGLWAIRGFSRIYFGSSADEPVPADYDGDGLAEIAIYDQATGRWFYRRGRTGPR